MKPTRAQRGLGLHVFQAQARLDLANAPVSPLRAPPGTNPLCYQNSSKSCACWCGSARRSRRYARPASPLSANSAVATSRMLAMVRSRSFTPRSGAAAEALRAVRRGRLAHQRSSNQFVHSQPSISEPQPALPPRYPRRPQRGARASLRRGGVRPWGPGRQAPGLVSAKLARCISLSISLPRFRVFGAPGQFGVAELQPTQGAAHGNVRQAQVDAAAIGLSPSPGSWP